MRHELYPVARRTELHLLFAVPARSRGALLFGRHIRKLLGLEFVEYVANLPCHVPQRTPTYPNHYPFSGIRKVKGKLGIQQAFTGPDWRLVSVPDVNAVDKESKTGTMSDSDTGTRWACFLAAEKRIAPARSRAEAIPHSGGSA